MARHRARHDNCMTPVGLDSLLSADTAPRTLVAAEGLYPWFALKVRARNEHLAALSLRGKNYTCFLPTYPERRRYSDRLKQVDTALFPGYVFCRFDPQWRLPVLTTPSVEYVVGTGKVPEPVEEEHIAAIQRIVDSGLLAKPWPYLKLGQRVRIQEGPLTGIEGLLVNEKGLDRLIVSVHLLQRSVAAEINRNWIRPA